MEATYIRDFTRGNITKQLVTFAWPLFLSNLLQVVYNMVDMIIVGHVLGKTGTAAISVGGDVSGFLTFMAMGFSSAGQVLIARYIGTGEREKLGRFMGTMTGFLMLCAVIISILSLLFGLHFQMEHYGFWLGDALAGFTPFFIGVAFYCSGIWKRQKEPA